MKADIFRILILYHYGGIYIDIKSILNNIDPIFKKYPNKDFYTASFKDDKVFKFINNVCKSKYIISLLQQKVKVLLLQN